jgi:hypothetical protein
VEASKLTSDDILLNIRNDMELTPIQEQILIGKMLGDGTLRIKNNNYINTAHIEWGQNEEEYTNWCLQGLQELAYNSETRISGYGTTMHCAKTKNTVSIYNKFKSWVESGHKEVPENIVLTPISIAFWYMDDGALEHFQGQEDRVRFATNGFNKTSCEYLLRELNKYDIDASVKDYKGNTICLNSENSEKLFLLISPYICDCKKYKLPERYRDVVGYIPQTSENQYHKLVVEQKVLSISIDSKPRERWDIETETHNFFTTGGLVHNTNIRIYWDGHKVSYYGRTENSQIPSQLMNRLIELFGGNVNEEMFEQKFGETPVMLIGEGYGAKIQKTGDNYRADNDFILFDVCINDNYQTRDSVKNIAAYFNIDVVPTIMIGKLQDGIDYVKTKPKSKIGTADSEGLVARPLIELRDRCGKRVIVKIKVWDFEE